MLIRFAVTALCALVIAVFSGCQDERSLVLIERSTRTDRSLPTSTYTLVDGDQRRVLTRTGDGIKYSVFTGERYVAFSHHVDGNGDGTADFDTAEDYEELVVLSQEDGFKKPVFTRRNVSAFSLNEQAGKLAVAVKIDGRFNMIIRDLASGDEKTVYESANWAMHPKFNADGSYLGFYLSDKEKRLYNSVALYGLISGTLQVLSRRVGNGWKLYWRDGQLCFIMQAAQKAYVGKSGSGDESGNLTTHLNMCYNPDTGIMRVENPAFKLAVTELD